MLGAVAWAELRLRLLVAQYFLGCGEMIKWGNKLSNKSPVQQGSAEGTLGRSRAGPPFNTKFFSTKAVGGKGREKGSRS